jgi:hypothetical protein
LAGVSNPAAWLEPVNSVPPSRRIAGKVSKRIKDLIGFMIGSLCG